MSEQSKKTQKVQTKPHTLVMVTLAHNMEEAKDYETLLKLSGIPAVIKKQQGQANSTDGIAVMVSEESLDEAHVIIESQDAYDDFCDFTIEDEDYDDFDDTSFDEHEAF